MSRGKGSVLTDRLRLEPIGPGNAADYWLVHNDPAVVPWYDGWQPSLREAEEQARQIGESWVGYGVHKWMAYDAATGEVVGRGGLSRTQVDGDWGQIYSFLPDEPWIREAYEVEQPGPVHAHWLELGWALRREYWGRGLASEIGAAGLAYAFDTIGVDAVVSCTLRHNLRSRAVMDRIGMRYVGEIYSRGTVEGADGPSDEAPFAVSVMLKGEHSKQPRGLPGAV